MTTTTTTITTPAAATIASSLSAGSRPAPATLDILAYPHLLDAIILASPRATLLTLRQTSHYVRTLVDMHLGAHVQIRDAEDVGTHTYVADLVRSPSGRMPALRPRDSYGWLRPDFGLSAALRFHRARCLALLGRARTLDIEHVKGGMSHLFRVQLAAAFSGLECVRYTPNSWGRYDDGCDSATRLAARTAVLFTNPFARDRGLHESCLPPPQGADALLVAPVLPAGVKKLVIHVLHHADQLSLGVSTLRPALEGVEHLVLVFNASAAPAPACTAKIADLVLRKGAVRRELLAGLLQAALASGTRVTLVKFDTTPAVWLGGEPDPAGSLLAAVEDGLAARYAAGGMMDRYEAAAAAAARAREVEFVSGPDYAAGLGARERAQEGWVETAAERRYLLA
ncbi:hypothetical protein Q8F55_007655 [Vanrija albida]|uniref:F-box domain-containing protein n=1 Tax=Vanrija albida TaxID=181172 RepID=A0ABR3PU49_9TREE